MQSCNYCRIYLNGTLCCDRKTYQFALKLLFDILFEAVCSDKYNGILASTILFSELLCGDTA